MKQTLSLFSVLFLCSLLIFVFGTNPASAAATVCVYENDLTIEKVADQSYKVRNNSLTCDYTITLTAYDMPHAEGEPNWINDQELLDVETAHFAIGEEKVMAIDDTASKYCRIQVDLNRGGAESVLTPPFYYNSLAAHIYTKSGCAGTPTPTATPVVTATPVPTATPSPTPSVVPSVSPTPSVTVVPTPTPLTQGSTTPSGDGRSDGLGCAQHDCSGNAIGGGNPSVLGITTPVGGVLPTTGVSELLMAVLSAMIVGLSGWELRKYRS